MLKTIWRRLLAEKIARSVEARLTPAYDAKIRSIEAKFLALLGTADAALLSAAAASDSERAGRIEAAELIRSEIRNLARGIQTICEASAALGDDKLFLKTVVERIDKARPKLETLYIPPIGLVTPTTGSFMQWSTCSAVDFLMPEFSRICEELCVTPLYHRKLWEWVFIVHHLRRLDMLTAGKRGLVFGVGTESLPSLFARDGVEVLATNAPDNIGAHWASSGEFASRLDDLCVTTIVDAEIFHKRVSYATCDMNAISEEFSGFDFCWSSCCFEHLGSLQAGLDFVVNSVEKTLKPGGVACHTTEFNLSSNEETVETGSTVIYRKRDIEGLISCLRSRGHEVDAFQVAPDQHPLDFYVDVPPYIQRPHLRLNLFGYTSTSVGLIIRRGY
nr:hypothetical protein [uncultured Lichenicoccus sp.]